MKEFFTTPERLAALEKSAQMWAGTPFRDNSCKCGDGANCVGAIAGVLWQAGMQFPQYPQGRTDWSRYQTESLMERWLNDRPQLFAPVDMAAIQSGDVVGFQAGLCVHHLGLVLEGGRFFQCNESLGAVILSQAEPIFKKRARKAWRPIES